MIIFTKHAKDKLRKIDRNHVLRVVYKQEFGIVKVITFYPGRIKQYEK